MRAIAQDYEDMKAKMVVLVARKVELERKYQSMANANEQLKLKSKQKETGNLDEHIKGMKERNTQKDVLHPNCRILKEASQPDQKTNSSVCQN
jgi:hypothetical protein